MDQLDGSANSGRETCMQAWQSELDPRIPLDSRRELTPERYPLTVTQEPWYTNLYTQSCMRMCVCVCVCVCVCARARMLCVGKALDERTGLNFIIIGLCDKCPALCAEQLYTYMCSPAYTVKAGGWLISPSRMVRIYQGFCGCPTTWLAGCKRKQGGTRLSMVRMCSVGTKIQ